MISPRTFVLLILTYRSSPASRQEVISALSRTISLTSFIDLALGNPSQRISRVAEARQLYQNSDELGFDPDFYAPVKELVRAVLTTGTLSGIDPFLDRFRGDPRKFPSFEACADGLRNWRVVLRTELIDIPRRVNHTAMGLTIRVNPELHAVVDGEELLLKLYLKDEPASKARLKAPLYLLETATRGHRGTAGVGILDLRRGKIYRANGLARDAAHLLDEDMASFSRIWARLDEEDAA